MEETNLFKILDKNCNVIFCGYFKNYSDVFTFIEISDLRDNAHSLGLYENDEEEYKANMAG